MRRPLRFQSFAPCLGLAWLLTSFSAFAQDPGPSRAPLRWTAPPDHDEGQTQPDRVLAPTEQRPFAYATDPSLPQAGQASLEYLLQGASGTEATRPLAANIGAQGYVQGLTVTVAATSWMAPFATGMWLQPPSGSEESGKATGQAGFRFQLTPAKSALRMGLITAMNREFAGSWGSYARASVTYDMGPVRWVANAHFEKIFASGRDSIDMLAIAGASVRTTKSIRLGMEYVGQDLEDAFEKEEYEGGARHFLGPVASLQLANDSLWITASPAFGLSEQTPGLMGRLTVLALF